MEPAYLYDPILLDDSSLDLRVRPLEFSLEDPIESVLLVKLC